MITEEEYGCFITPDRVRVDAAKVERAGFVLRYKAPLGQLDDIVDRAMIDSGFLEQLCAQADGDQEPTDNWREVLRAL